MSQVLTGLQPIVNTQSAFFHLYLCVIVVVCVCVCMYAFVCFWFIVFTVNIRE